MSKQMTVYLKFDQCVLVKQKKVLLSDVASIYETEPAMRQKIGALELYRFPKEQKEKKIFSVMKVIEIIGSAYPEITVNPVGEPDFIVEYKPEKKKIFAKPLEWCKTAFVALSVFFGSAFTIVTFNKDSSVEEIFPMIYRLTEGAERKGPGELEIAYGVILLRPTVSPIVYKQQIGRALATGKKKIPVIFDMVNNFESLQYVGELVNEFEEQKELLKKYGRSAYVEVEEFRIFDEMREARQLLELLQKNLDASWEDYYEVLKAYVAEKGNAKVPCGYVTTDGLQLGKWLQRQKGFFRAGRMAADRKALLLELCGTMEYDNKLQFNHWMDLLRQYKEEHGDVLVKCPYITGNGERLGEWCSNMKTRYREGTLSEEVIRRLEDIGFCWSIKQNNWEKGYEHAKAYCEEKGNLDVEKRYRSPDGYPLGQWLLAQRRIQSGKERGGRRLTEEQFTRLDALGMRWESQEDILFEEYVELFCRYKEKYQMTSIPTSHREEGRPLGQWAFKIRKRKKEGELPREWEERLNEIGFLWDMSFPIWYCQYRKAKEYYEENGTLTISSKYKEQHGEQLSVWLLRQRRLYREKRFDLLTEERIQLLDEIGFQWQIQR